MRFMRSQGRFAALAASAALAAALVGAPVAAESHSGITYTVSPITRFAFRQLPAGGFPVPSVCVKTFGLACYTPQDIRTGYDVPASLTGQGQIIVIVDAYGSPVIAHDLAVFDQTFGLPNPALHVIYPDGRPAFNPESATELGWASETTLDVEWSHAIAPDAAIDLVIAPGPGGNAINMAERYAVDHHLGNVLSMSFGSPEGDIQGQGNNLQIAQADQIDQAAAAEGISLFAAAGDEGATNGLSFPNADFPASNPYVTAVGGTDLFLSDSGQYQSETVWNDSDPSLCPFGCQFGVIGATGGAPSLIFPAPAYQSGVTGFSMRTTADVAYNASVYTAVIGYMSVPGEPAGYYFFGGTSEGAPQWAAIGALADQAAGKALGPLNPLLYAIAQRPSAYAADFHDVTVGQNGLNGPGYAAKPGYDVPTGLGSPNVAPLVAALAKGQ